MWTVRKIFHYIFQDVTVQRKEQGNKKEQLTTYQGSFLNNKEVNQNVESLL
jgi:hypothetical protein